MKKRTLSGSVLLLLLPFLTLSACKKEDKSSELSLQEKYTITESGVYPEGVDYDNKNKRFLIGSFNKGTVYIQSTDGKQFSAFINDPKLVATTGVYTDEDRDRYIILSGDAGASEKSLAEGASAGAIAYAGIYNSNTGALIKGIDLKSLVSSGGVFPNDIAVDNDGNIYITDSFAPIIYKITADYTASVFINNALLAPPAKNFGLNGIVYHKDGYLIVAKTSDNKLFKISLKNSEVSEIAGAGMKVTTPDGLEWSKDNNLIVVENGLGSGSVHVLQSQDNWTSATETKVIAIGQSQFPTTATLASGEIYVLSSKLGYLLGGDKGQSNFILQKIATK